MRVNEIFPSIDGEVNGFNGQGEPTVFIRLQGCSAKCSYCDTEYAQDPSKGREMAVDQVVEEVKRYKIHKVTITGGEPTEQRTALMDLVSELSGFRITIETNGLNKLFYFAHSVYTWVMDYKLPCSGLKVEEEVLEFNLRKMCPGRDWIKFVIQTVQDFNEAGKVIRDYKLEQFNIAMSPVYGKLEPKMLFTWMRGVGTYHHINCQLHKFVGMK